jgi:hypothetical protein
MNKVPPSGIAFLDELISKSMSENEKISIFIGLPRARRSRMLLWILDVFDTMVVVYDERRV